MSIILIVISAFIVSVSSYATDYQVGQSNSNSETSPSYKENANDPGKWLESNDKQKNQKYGKMKIQSIMITRIICLTKMTMKKIPQNQSNLMPGIVCCFFLFGKEFWCREGLKKVDRKYDSQAQEKNKNIFQTALKINLGQINMIQVYFCQNFWLYKVLCPL